MLPKVNYDYVVERYLSPAQIEEVLKTLLGVADLSKQIETIELIHRFVVSNGKTDKKYMCLYDALMKLSDLLNFEDEELNFAKTGGVIGYSALLVSYFSLVGIIAEKDVEDFMKTFSIPSAPNKDNLA